MTRATPTRETGNIFLRMHPLERISLSLLMALIAFSVIYSSHYNWQIVSIIVWDAFAATFILTSWIVFFTRRVDKIIQQANKDDGSRFYVMASILLTSFASMFTVLLLMIGKEQPPELKLITIFSSISGMMLSWIMVHTIFAFHYAHLYYGEETDDTPDKEALDFPGETKPDYIDFAYFSFVIGTTFQVSDVEISSRKIRRIALLHSLLAFVLNTFVVALTINVIAGLKK